MNGSQQQACNCAREHLVGPDVLDVIACTALLLSEKQTKLYTETKVHLCNLCSLTSEQIGDMKDEMQ